MKITLIQERSIHFTTVPDSVNGEYCVMYTSVDGTDEALVNISKSGGGCVMECGGKSFICTKSGDDSYRKMNIDENTRPISIQIRRTGEKAIMIFGSDRAEMTAFKKYNISSGIVIGSGAECDVCVKSPLMPTKACEIAYDGKETRLRECFPEVRAFVNGKRVSETVLKHGDLVFLYGFLVVIGKGFVAFNMNPLLSVNSFALSEMIPAKRDETEIARYFDENNPQIDTFTIVPRFEEKINPVVIDLEDSQEPSREKRPAVLALGPSFTMGVGAAVTGMFTVISGINSGREMTAVIPSVVMSGSMLASAIVWPFISRLYDNALNRKERRNVLKGYLNYLERIRLEISEAASEQKAVLCKRYPHASELSEIVTMRSEQLWEKLPEHEDYLCVCVGYGEVAPEIELKYKDRNPTAIHDDILSDERNKLLAEKIVMKDAPVFVSLTENRRVGIVGEKSKTFALARAMIYQLVSLHSSKAVKLALIYDKKDAEEWRFMRWLPHVWNDGGSARYIASDVAELKALSLSLEGMLNNEEGSQYDYVMVCADCSLGSKTDLVQHILENKAENRVSVIMLCDEYRHLPKECTAIIDLSGEPVLKTRNSETRGFSVYEDEESFEKSAITLANTRLSATEGKYALPSAITFLELYGVSRLEELNCSARWAENNPVNSLAAPIGIDIHGEIINLDLHQEVHGPHGLIAGTTGSGKSEFIITFILSLAVNFSPRDISFLLIDYKGGGMAAAFSKLPHTAGIITNLDGAEISRSMVVIKSEMRRRQEIFLEVGEKVGETVNDIYTYQRISRERSDIKPLSHLFIISDEFAELKKQEPEFMDGLISAARIGRSLGIHLILATQKPSGVVSAEIWSNSRFKICLKVQDKEDSTEVIRRPDAAALTQTGRFYMQVGFNEIFELGQSAWSGADYEPESASAHEKDNVVSVIDNIGRIAAQARPEIKRNEKAVKQIKVITDYIIKCAEANGITADPLWLPVLPPYIGLCELEKQTGYAPNERLDIVIGKIDIPEKQLQEDLLISAAGGNTLIYGMEGAGKSEFLITYIYSILKNYPPNKAAVYILDFAGETLNVFEKYNGVGAFINASKERELGSLFDHLESEVAKRRSKLAENAASFLEYNAGHSDMPLINVVISNYDSFKETYEDYDPKIEMLTREGQRVGIFFVLTTLAGASLRFRMIRNFKRTLVLRLTDNSYSGILGATNGKRPGESVGRGLLKHPEYDFVCEFQTAFVTDKNVFQFIKDDAQRVNRMWNNESVFKIKELPKTYTAEAAEEYRLEKEPLNIPIALGERFCEPVRVDFAVGVKLILHSGADIAPTARQLAEYAAKRVRTIVFDPTEAIGECASCEYVSGDKSGEKIAELYSLVLDRCKKISEAEKSGSAVDYSGDRVFVVIGDYGEVRRRITSSEQIIGGEKQKPEDMIKRFGIMLEGVTFDCGVTFAIFARSGNLHGCREDWFAKTVDLSTYLWLGDGISNENFFKHERIKAQSGDRDADMGYNVVNGKAQTVKFMRKGNQDGKDQS